MIASDLSLASNAPAASTAAEETSSNVLARAVQLAWRALLLGLVAGVAGCALELSAYGSIRDAWLPALLRAWQITVPVALAMLALWVALRGLGMRSSVLTAGLLVVPWSLLALQVNQRILPGITEPVSLVGNAALAVGFLVVWFTLMRWLTRWYDGAWRSGGSFGAALAALLLTAAAPAAGALASAMHERDPAPDVLVLLVDVLRADQLGAYGYERPTSPNIDALAEDSIFFENFASASTYTKTSVSSLFTGLTAHHHGVYEGSFGQDPTKVQSDVLSHDFTTLAEAMHGEGLQTAGWVENGQLRAYMGFDQGFALYHDQPGDIEVITDQYLDWHREWADVTRSFVYLHFIDLHAPYHPKLPYRGTFGSAEELATANLDYPSWQDFKTKVAMGEIVLTPEEIREFEAKYDELILYVDDWIGRIIADLKARGRYDDTMIVLTADHGEGFWEHGFISHSNVPFDELVHIPLLVKMPGSDGAGRRVDDMVGLIDLAPTLIEFAGGTPPASMDGESFLPLLTDADASLEERWRFLEYREIVGVRTERWKYIDRPYADDLLFDMLADPGELTNLLETHPDVVHELHAAVKVARDIRAGSDPAARVTLDEETVEALQALGYL